MEFYTPYLTNNIPNRELSFQLKDCVVLKWFIIHKFNLSWEMEWEDSINGMGRFYQQGALWQVGVKIYTGYNKTSCLWIIITLSDISDQLPKSSIERDIVNLVASYSLNQIRDTSRSEHVALKDFVEKCGQRRFRYCLQFEQDHICNVLKKKQSRWNLIAVRQQWMLKA